MEGKETVKDMAPGSELDVDIARRGCKRGLRCKRMMLVACRRSVPNHHSIYSLLVHAGRPVHNGRVEGVRASLNLLTVLFGKVMSASISLWRLATSSGSSPPSGVGGRKETSSPLALYMPLSAATKSPANWEHGW